MKWPKKKNKIKLETGNTYLKSCFTNSKNKFWFQRFHIVVKEVQYVFFNINILPTSGLWKYKENSRKDGGRKVTHFIPTITFRYIL